MPVINSLNSCINTAVAKVFFVSFGNNVDFIQQLTGLTDFSVLVLERRSRFLANCISFSVSNSIDIIL